MKSINSKKLIEKSKINYDYKSIRITKSRIEKGLLAIPKSFSNYLPNSNQKIKVYLNDSVIPQIKTFSSFDSPTNENRIGGLKNWFLENEIKEGDEIVLQILDKEKFIYRLFKEEIFLKKTEEFQTDFDNSKDEKTAEEKIERISNLTQVDQNKIVYNEFLRLTKYSNEEVRKRLKISNRLNRETTPSGIRTILGNIYGGHCQACSFFFWRTKKNKKNVQMPRNLILVCANCHRQFEYADVIKDFNIDGWLIRVLFNQKEYLIKQAVNEIKKQDFLKTVFI